MATSLTVNTIGFTKTSAERFFGRLRAAGVRRVLDVRLHNTSQLAGFAKSEDLAYFLREIVGIEYRHVPLMAPEERMLAVYKKGGGAWDAYEAEFLRLMAARRIENFVQPEHLNDACLLCSEDKPHHCHRRLVCEYLNRQWGGVMKVRHL
jgi:uncharacterized protein (DUF488 family)